MKSKFITFVLALLTSVGTLFAWDYEHVQIGDLYYNLDATNLTAEVTYKEFYYNYSINAVSIPLTLTWEGKTYSVTSIGEYAFKDCSSLTSFTIPNSVTSIGNNAFFGCYGLTSIDIPNSVTSIEYRAFIGCYGLTSIDIPNSVTSIGAAAFDDCSGLTSITIPNSVTNIGEGAFGSCRSLISIIVESGNSMYDSRDNCNAIIETSTNTLIAGCKNTIIPNSVTSIGESAFNGCSSLSSVTIPNSVTSIEEYAFYGCSGLSSVTIPNSVTSIGDVAFGKSSLTSIMVVSENSNYDSRDNCNAIIETESNKLIVGCQNTIIPNSVTSIGDKAFYRCSGLTSVTIPNSVTSIGKFAFYQCSGLTSVTIPNSVTSIGEYAFYLCSSLSDILVKWTTSEALASVSLGSNVFYYNVPTSAKLHIPAEAWGCYSAYPWNDFTNRVATCNDDVDNTSFFSAQNGNTIDFELGRTLYKDGYYNTICLPFDIDDFEGTPLEGATVKEFVNAEVVDGCLELNVTDAASIEAGKPYLVSFENGEDITDAVFEEVTIATSTAQTIDGGAVDFVGILAPTDLELNNTNMLFLGANNELYWPNTNDPLRGYRAYFAVNSGSSAPVRYGMPARIVEQQNTATAIGDNAAASMPEKKLVNGELVISRGNTSYNVLGMTIR